MSLSTHLSIRLVGALLAIGIVLATRYGMRRLWLGTPSTVELAGILARQVVTDLKTGTYRASWIALLCWATLLLTAHYSWLAVGAYTQLPWLDVLAHAMGGAGVAGIVLVGLRSVPPTDVSGWWVVLLVLGIGAGFEGYEVLVKTFWYPWSLSVYVEDTLLDLLIDATSAGLVVSIGTRVASPVIRRYPS